ncbi:DUF805 domain-containing protein [Parvibaculum sp.]|uniref:DUF805 domain-containing protein n=1 Tax=Parvibaculum sp. TaxID=2024848 RepID=UPI00320D092D
MDIGSLLFSFRGRVNRRAYWGFALFASVVGLGTLYLTLQRVMAAGITPGMSQEEFMRAVAGVNQGWVTIVQLAMLWPTLAISVKRCHDRGRSGWFLLLLIVPLVQLWPLIEISLLRGTDGDNRFGPDPLAGAPQDSWKSWLIFVGFLIVSGAQFSLGREFMTYMMTHMPDLSQPRTPI